MSRKRDPKYDDAVQMYNDGKSIEEVAAMLGVTRQAAWVALRRRGVSFRQVKRKPKIEFNGNEYTMTKWGYYRKTYGDRSRLNRDVYEFHYGEIPAGGEIHHIDGDKTNNEIENLKCLSKRDHATLHGRMNRRKRRSDSSTCSPESVGGP